LNKRGFEDFSKSSIDKLARNTSAYTVEEISREISEVINNA
jgi:hypothetical protein